MFQKAKTFLGNFDSTGLESKYSLSQGFEDFFDEYAKQSYRYNKQTQIFATYPSKAFIKAAASYAKDFNLRGLMYWEYGHDMDSKLLKIITDEY